MKKLAALLGILAALAVLLLPRAAHATHFRYGNITYAIPNPVSQPLTVQLDVTVAWRSSYLPIDSTTLNFGDGTANPAKVGDEIGSGVDAAGLAYRIMHYRVTHTYPAAGQYVAYFTSCCRLSNLINAGDDSFRVEAKVNLQAAPGNHGGPVSQVPPIIQLQTGGIRSHFIPAVDPDGAPVTCRFATQAESMITTNPPVISGAAPTLTPSPLGCTLTWNTTGGIAGNQYAVQVVFESTEAGHVSSAVVDYILELVSSPPPTCVGSGTFNLDMGQSFTQQLTGTNVGGGNLKLYSSMTLSLATLTPPSGTTSASPFSTTLDWTPGQGDEGTQIALVLFTNPQSISGYCTLAFNVTACPQYGNTCSAGVGACQSSGFFTCPGGGPPVCSAVPGQPSPELCDNLDNDCNGLVDDGNPGAGQACQSGLPGVCGDGTTTCSGGNQQCAPNIVPGSQAETCNGVDDDCDGQVDDGFGIGTLCTVGNGECGSGGVFVCDGMGGAICNAMPGVPSAELCNGLDDDCDNQVDEDFALGSACTSGVGACEAAGVTVCDNMGAATCDAVPGAPGQEVCGNDVDEDCDGVLDTGCVDTDSDGIVDAVEQSLGLDPNDADTDDDGVMDGDEPSFDEDTDGDGLINALDADSDNDGLFDGTELGKDCAGPGTNGSQQHCIADADGGATTTDPLSADSDGGGASDGSEDANLDGQVDAGEADPNGGGDDGSVVDTDTDGLGDLLEATLGSGPNDYDSDDDGVPDGAEPNPSDDADGDGLTPVLDVDSDDDGLFDGTEMGLGCNGPGTNAGAGHCLADADQGASKTSPLARDTDGGGISDGSEDTNLDGAVDPGERDPNDASDDAGVGDSDSDGLGDKLEVTLGSNPGDPDSDDDGLLDGQEANPGDDGDGDGIKNILDPDSDGDGLFDGTESGKGCGGAGTDAGAGQCVADADNGATTTSPVDADSDNGGATDGEEDSNHDGAIGAGERDPNNPADDAMVPECVTDADCGAADSGLVCDAFACVSGCRAEGGNGCPEGQTCTSTNASIGQCEGGTTGAGGGGDTPKSGGDDGGCGCTLPGGAGNPSGLWLIALGIGAALARRRRSP